MLYFFDMSTKCWLRVGDDCFPASNFASSFSSTKVSARQVAHLWEFARNVLMWEFLFQGLQMMVCRHVHLETQSAASMALKSPHEYHQCLLSYIWFLARLVSLYMDC